VSLRDQFDRWFKRYGARLRIPNRSFGLWQAGYRAGYRAAQARHGVPGHFAISPPSRPAPVW